MNEREHDQNPYWRRHDLPIGEAHFPGEPQTIHLALDTRVEVYGSQGEIVPLSFPTGRRTHIHARPYILVPDTTSRLRCYETLPPAGAIGRAFSEAGRRPHQRDVGAVDALYYPSDELLILSQAYLFDFHPDPSYDDTLAILWDAVEWVLLDRFPDTQRIATPAFEGTYPPALWEEFLRNQGYESFNRQAFAKEVERP